jgi:UPF0755 protein
MKGIMAEAENNATSESRQRIRRLIIIGMAVITVIIAAVSILTYYTFYAKNFPDGETRTVTIPKGSAFSVIAGILYENEVIESRTFFLAAGKLLGLEDKIQRGMFEIPAGKSNLELLNDLKEGRFRKVIDVTIYEGLATREVAAILSRALDIDSTKFVELVNDSAFAAEFGVFTGSLKGYLLPDRYRFFGDDTEEDVIHRVMEEFWSFYSDSLQRRTQEMDLTIQDVLTMASIVEGETILDSEKPRVAGLYYNRLRRNMRLQADATVQYALIEERPRRLFNRDYRVNSPYNTYLFRGLPPGPINNPGRKAILASLYPEEHAYLYMVTDGTGGHTFSESYNDHLRAVRQFRQLRRNLERQQAGSSQNRAN